MGFEAVQVQAAGRGRAKLASDHSAGRWSPLIPPLLSLGLKGRPAIEEQGPSTTDLPGQPTMITSHDRRARMRICGASASTFRVGVLGLHSTLAGCLPEPPREHPTGPGDQAVLRRWGQRREAQPRRSGGPGSCCWHRGSRQQPARRAAWGRSPGRDRSPLRWFVSNTDGPPVTLGGLVGWRCGCLGQGWAGTRPMSMTVCWPSATWTTALSAVTSSQARAVTVTSESVASSPTLGVVKSRAVPTLART
jgi:hypothetical protein